MTQKLFCIALFWLCAINVTAQTSGLIYKPSSTVFGRSVLDPNGDGFTSQTYTGFSTDDFGAESELQMTGLPVLVNEPLSDLSTGPSGGHTDISNNGSGQSVYVLFKTVNNVDYLIIRFRIGSASTAPKGYALMLDTDNNFNNNYSSDNPGFEREVVLEASKRIRIYSHSASGVSILQTYDVNEYQQRSIAKSTGSGNTDYFYDFFVPYSALNISGNVRMAAATITNAQSGISGTSSDFQGINDSAYKGNKRAMMTALINSFPPVAITNITEGFTFPAGKTLSPAISSVSTQSTAITGTSLEANGTTITIYKGGVLQGTTTVNNNVWSFPATGLQVGNVLTATATASGKDVSSLSEAVTVTAQVSVCYTPAPVITGRQNGQRTVWGTWSNGSTITANNVRIRIYYQNPSTGSFTEEQAGTSRYVSTTGTWSFTGLGNSQPSYASRSYYVTATIGTATATTADDCTSAYSNGYAGNGNSGTITATPNLTPTTIVASIGSTNVSVQNTLAAAANLYLYVNGIQVQTASVAANATHVFSYAGFNEGDIVYARAQGTAAGSILSNTSNQVTVNVNTLTALTTAPVLNGPYVQGTQTITGTSIEAPGTVVTLYVNGVATANTTTVDIYGTFTFSNIAVTTGQVLTVRAKANGKTLGNASNSFTVQASAPAAPTVTGPLFVPTTATTSISGSGGSGTVTVYVDGTAIGTTTGANWTLNNVESPNLYRGAIITATNTSATGITSSHSAGVTVQGVVSFLITDTNGNAISEKKSGEIFDIIITAKNAVNGSGTTYSNFTGKVVVSSDAGMLVGGGQTISFVNGVATHTIALGDPGLNRYVFVINSDDPTAFGSRNLDMVEAIWRGTISTDYAVAGNWVYNFVPADGATISFAIPTINHCLLDQDRILGTITNAQGDYYLNLNGHKLTVNGELIFSNDAKIDASPVNSTLSFKGKDTQTLDAVNILNRTMYGLESAGLSTLTLNGPLDLTGELKLTSGTLDTQDSLTMKSNAVRTAIVAPVKGNITGDVTVERYIPARRAFRLICSPVNGGSIYDNWQEGAPAGDIPGFGTDITGAGGATNGFDASGSSNPSLFTFNNTSQEWSPVTNTISSNLTAGTPYRMLVRGDRTVNQASNLASPTNTTLRVTGTLVTGEVTMTDLSPVANNWNFLGSPYQSPVDLGAVVAASTNVNQNFYYVWDPTQGGAPVAGQTTGGRGSYIAITLPEGLSTGGSVANNYLQPSQGFFIQTLADGPASMTFKETNKGTANATPSLYRTNNTNSRIRLQLYDVNSLALNATPADGLIIDFNADYSNEVDAMDAVKFINQDETVAIRNGQTNLSIERRAMPLLTDVISLYNSQYRKTNYTYTIQVEGMEDVTAYLLDKYTNEATELVKNGETLYNFSVNSEDAATIDANRFDIVFGENALGSKDFTVTRDIKIYPNPASGSQFMTQVPDAANSTVTIFNALGQKVASTFSLRSENTLLVKAQSPMATGIYTVAITAEGNTTTKKLIIK